MIQLVEFIHESSSHTNMDEKECKRFMSNKLAIKPVHMYLVVVPWHNIPSPDEYIDDWMVNKVTPQMYSDCSKHHFVRIEFRTPIGAYSFNVNSTEILDILPVVF